MFAFLGTAAEQKRIAALEPDNGDIFFTVFYKKVGDFILCLAVSTGAFADIDKFSVNAGFEQKFRCGKPVVEHDIGIPE